MMASNDSKKGKQVLGFEHGMKVYTKYYNNHHELFIVIFLKGKKQVWRFYKEFASDDGNKWVG